MFKIIATCVLSLAFGALLASHSIAWPIRPGFLGAGLLIGLAFWVRGHWKQRATASGDEPSDAEQNVWLWMVGTALITGLVVSVLFQPGSEVHTRTGDTGGYDSWLMLAGIFIAYSVLRNKNIQKDERDIAIANFGTKAGYCALMMLLVVFLLSLGFAPQDMMQRFTHWLIANTLVTLIMASCLVQYMAQLICYWLDMRNLRAGP